MLNAFVTRWSGVKLTKLWRADLLETFSQPMMSYPRVSEDWSIADSPSLNTQSCICRSGTDNIKQKTMSAFQQFFNPADDSLHSLLRR
jgi:hypothetical protein